MLCLLGLCSTAEAAGEVAERHGGRAWADHDRRDSSPYRGVFAVAGDDIEALLPAADVSLHVAFGRVIKAVPANVPAERVIASFAMKHHPDLTHRQADDHWRDLHAPLALRSHSAMCDYEQLSVLTTVAGEAIDGLAMCAFASRQDVSTKFFDDDAAKAAVGADVAQFADLRASLPRVVLRQTH